MRKTLLLLAAVICSGCLRSTTLITVKPDGSGTILQETGLSQQALAMIKSMAAAGGDAKMPADVFGESQAKQAADMMGVTFVSGEPIKTADLEGYRARFSFTDIRKVQMKMNQNAPAGLSGAGATSGESPFQFGFERKGAASQLTINVPELKPGQGPMGAMPKMGADTNPAQTQQAIAMMKMMLQNLYVDVSVDVDGRIVNTNASNVQGSRITLLQLDFNKMLADESALLKLQGANDLKALSGVPGIKIMTTPKVTVEFAK